MGVANNYACYRQLYRLVPVLFIPVQQFHPTCSHTFYTCSTLYLSKFFWKILHDATTTEASARMCFYYSILHVIELYYSMCLEESAIQVLHGFCMFIYSTNVIFANYCIDYIRKLKVMFNSLFTIVPVHIL